MLFLQGCIPIPLMALQRETNAVISVALYGVSCDPRVIFGQVELLDMLLKNFESSIKVYW